MINHKKALNYFQNMYLVAVADHNLAKEETEFLVQVAQNLGIGVREASEIMMRTRDTDFIIPETDAEILAQMEDIVLMMMVDRKINEKEYELCLSYAKAVGKDRKILDEIIFKILKDK